MTNILNNLKSKIKNMLTKIDQKCQRIFCKINGCIPDYSKYNRNNDEVVACVMCDAKKENFIWKNPHKLMIDALDELEDIKAENIKFKNENNFLFNKMPEINDSIMHHKSKKDFNVN